MYVENIHENTGNEFFIPVKEKKKAHENTYSHASPRLPTATQQDETKTQKLTGIGQLYHLASMVR